jgi:hypothetical protein
MSKDGLSAIQLSRQIARYLHAGLRLLNRRLVPLTHYWLSSLAIFRLKRLTRGDQNLLDRWPHQILLFYLVAVGDNFKSYFHTRVISLPYRSNKWHLSP